MRSIIFLLILFPCLANADTYLELFLSSHDGQHGRNLYVEKSVGAKTSALFYRYEDSFYESNYVGLSRLLNDVQVGLGIGQAKYDDKKYIGYNPWFWYRRNGWDSYAEYEYIPNDKDNYYYRGYLYKDISSHFFAGIYTERSVGSGPAVGLKFEGEQTGILFNVAKPAINKPQVEEEATDWVGYVTFWLAF